MAEARSARGKTAEKDLSLRTYEAGYWIVPDIDDDALAAAVGDVRSHVEGAGGSVFGEEFPVSKRLSYPIKRRWGDEIKQFSNGYFGSLRFDASADAVRVIAGALSEDRNVIRILMTHAPRPPRPARVGRSGMGVISRTRVRERSPLASGGEDVKAPALSEEELDRTIDELVIE